MQNERTAAADDWRSIRRRRAASRALARAARRAVEPLPAQRQPEQLDVARSLRTRRLA